VLAGNPQLRKKIPNAITVARLVIAGIFFAMLRFYDHGTPAMAWWLFAAGWVYGLAAATDWVDGHLARKWDAGSTFGKVVDPFCDKILVLGTFVFFASEVFLTDAGESLTGVGPVVVIMLLGRELLVTTLRSLTATQPGGAQGAKWAGKFKMVFQSIAIPVILVYVVLRGWFPIALAPGESLEIALRVLREIAVWGTVVVTVCSTWEYLPTGKRVSSEPGPG
jgi:CDP-diacylglycerol--glycerol-3-phosphate 3-phosphatidyltransferase